MGILLTGKISSENITLKILNKIEIKDKVNTSHKWIENIKDKELYNNINKLKKSIDIKKELIKLYPKKKCKIINVKEMDEIYISIPPKKFHLLRFIISKFINNINTTFIGFINNYRIINIGIK
jgi:hypothetical protein